VADDSSGPVPALGSTGRRAFEWLQWIVGRLIAPLRADDGPNEFRLSSVETHTTTLDGDTGWAYRPPATLRCPECATDIVQGGPREPIDCPTCPVDLSPERFADLELLALRCPLCRTRMQHGRRHPETFDVPEWATCPNCQYHWEFKHFY